RSRRQRLRAGGPPLLSARHPGALPGALAAERRGALRRRLRRPRRRALRGRARRPRREPPGARRVALPRRGEPPLRRRREGGRVSGPGISSAWGAAAVALGAYLLGSISWSYLIVRAVRGEDVRTLGSGNAGATNALRAAGKGAGVAVLLLDAGKGAAAVAGARALGASPG